MKKINLLDLQIKKATKDLDVNGYYVQKDFISKKKSTYLLNLIKRIYKFYNKKNVKIAHSRDKSDKIIYNLQNYSYEFIKLFNHKFIKKLMMKSLNDPFYGKIKSNKPNYTLKGLNARSSGKKLDFHIDTYFPFKGNKTFMYQVAIPLEKSDLETGCTIVVKKSHKSGKFSDRKNKTFQKLIANPGDLVIWDSRIWHGALENKTEKSRWQLIATFGCWWIKPQFDLTYKIPKKILKKCNNEEKTILGFFSITPKDELERISTKTGY